MNVIGISGIERSIPFKQAHWPGLDAREYRICQGHDAAAALVADGKVVAAVAEERLNRRKHSGDFPRLAIAACLKQAGLRLDDVDELAHGFDYRPFRGVFSTDPVTTELYRDVYSREALLRLVARDLPEFPAQRIHHVGHHLAHAASAYYTSGWDESLVIVIDGIGEVESASVYHAHQGTLDRLHQVSARDSIGILYSLITLHLGFEFNADEYKIMGLAPYGDPQRFRLFFDETVELQDNGSIRIPLLRMNRTRDERENYRMSREQLARCLVPPRRPGEPITDDHRDVAAALQACLDRTLLHLCGRFGESTGLRRLALAGGVALNCTANGRLLHSGLFDEIYVQPAAGDDGAALGAALYRAAQAGEVRNERFPVPFLGPSHSSAEINRALAERAGEIEVTRFATFAESCDTAARLIAQGRVIAWYRGRMEFGPRALGNRSILADPGHPDMRDRINAMVKKREAFRPFAPAVTLEEVHRWFDVRPGTDLPYMITTVDVRDQCRAALPAVTHINGSARVQTVSAESNPDFYGLLKAVGKTTGREMVLNTSFNVKGQPIVATPSEALETFLGTGIEVLFLDNTMVRPRGPEAAS